MWFNTEKVIIMHCEVYLSKVLKSTYTLESELTSEGVKTVITFPLIGVKGIVVASTPVGKGNNLELILKNSSDWKVLSTYLM